MGLKSEKTKTLTIDPAKWKAKFANDTAKVDFDSIIEEMGKSFQYNVLLCCDRGKKKYKGDFFIVVLSNLELVAEEILRSRYLHRASCPTPNYDQIVFHYSHRDDVLRELWVIPSRSDCHALKEHALEAKIDNNPLLPHVLNFADGTLDDMMREFNGEKQFSLELEVQKIKELRKQGDLFK